MRKPWNGWSLVISLVLVAVWLGVSVVPTAAVDVSPAPTPPPKDIPQYPELTGPDVVSFPIGDDLPMRNTGRRILQGKPIGQGCEFTHETPAIRPGDPIPAGRVLAYDTKTCRALLEEGEYAGPPLDKLSRPSPIPATQPEGMASTTPDTSKALLTSYAYEYKGWWKDPPGWTMSEARPYLRWTGDGQNVSNCSGNTNTWQNGNSGWYEVQKDPSVYYDGSSRCVSQANVHHQNDVFCALQTTHSYFQPIRISGYGWGQTSGFEDTWVTGSTCAGWLSYSYTGPYPIP